MLPTIWQLSTAIRMRRGAAVKLIALACLAGSAAYPAMSFASWSAPSAAIEIQTEDVTRVYSVYEAAGGHPTAEQIQRDYPDGGTEGLRHLTPVRNVNAQNIARAVETRPEFYTKARTCLAARPRIRARPATPSHTLPRLPPDAAPHPATPLLPRPTPPD